MEFEYIYESTEKIRTHLIDIDSNQKASRLLPSPQDLVLHNWRQRTNLQSAVYSARIEGNPLNVKQFENSPPSTHKQEIQNLNSALEWIYRQPRGMKVTIPITKKLHKMCLESIGPEPGIFRTEQSAIYNAAGVAIYFPPPPQEIKEKLDKLTKAIKTSTHHHLITTAMAHFTFQKIHPFLDGNGRVGRLTSTILLRQKHYDFYGLLNLDKYLEKHRQTYYDLLNINLKNITPFIEYFLAAISHQSQLALQKLGSKKEVQTEDTLLPRRQEIYHIIRDHKLVTFDFIQRRFIEVPRSTLHYDLSQLRKIGIIKKVGSTRGALYSPT